MLCTYLLGFYLLQLLFGYTLPPWRSSNSCRWSNWRATSWSICCSCCSESIFTGHSSCCRCCKCLDWIWILPVCINSLVTYTSTAVPKTSIAIVNLNLQLTCRITIAILLRIKLKKLLILWLGISLRFIHSHCCVIRIFHVALAILSWRLRRLSPALDAFLAVLLAYFLLWRQKRIFNFEKF